MSQLVPSEHIAAGLLAGKDVCSMQPTLGALKPSDVHDIEMITVCFCRE